MTSDNHWRRFCHHFQRTDLLDNPRYATNQLRVKERHEIRPVVAECVVRHTLAELTVVFDEIDIPFAPVARPGALFDDPQLNAGGRMLDIEFKDGKHAKIPRMPVEIGTHDLGLRRQAPAIGQHTDEVLQEVGLTRKDVDELHARGIISGPAR
jgi:crotonobetainyl-CoA:carnitine CoA-transferase CaiB-like acyl-CoA transferase